MLPRGFQVTHGATKTRQDQLLKLFLQMTTPYL